jgi:hypothetical protein
MFSAPQGEGKDASEAGKDASEAEEVSSVEKV